MVKSNDGRHLSVLIEYREQKVLLSNIYAPNSDDITFFQEVFNNILLTEHDQFILGGDFNKILDLDMDRKSVSPMNSLSSSAKFILETITEHGWVDAWRYFHPDEQTFTWYRKKEFLYV